MSTFMRVLYLISATDLLFSRVAGVYDLKLLDEEGVDCDGDDGAEVGDEEGDEPEPASDTERRPGSPIDGGNDPGMI